MAQRVEIFQVTCPPNTPQASAPETLLSMLPGIVRTMQIIVPPGHNGLTGLAIAQAHQVIIPASGSTWIIGDDDKIDWPLDGYLDADTWSAFAYNLDPVYPHSWYLRMLVDELQSPVSPGASPIPVTDIYAATGAGAA